MYYNRYSSTYGRPVTFSRRAHGDAAGWRCQPRVRVGRDIWRGRCAGGVTHPDLTVGKRMTRSVKRRDEWPSDLLSCERSAPDL